MADKNLNVRIKHKYDTEANWSSKNPVLLKGEIAFSSDKNGQFKIGDGTNKWSALNYNSVPWSGVTGKPSTFTPTSHKHTISDITNISSASVSYATSAGSATKLGTSAGSATQPVYFSDGKPVATTYTLSASVPAGAKFTDTNTWRPLGTTGDTACAGNDSRLSNARPASDVYSWAKASSKPSYSWGEITGKPGTFNPSSHSHKDLDAIGTVGYYGSDVANSNGWYKVYSTTLTNYNDHVARLSIVSGYYPYASGLLILHLRCNNTTSLAVQQLIWETRQGFNADDVIINTNGNTWTLYLKITNSQYGRVKIRVLESVSTTSNWSMSLSNNSTKESTNPKATATAKDGATVNYANSAGSVAWGNVSGRPSSMPASDVYSWAKASSKPSYSWSEITGKPGSFTPSSHTHNYAGSSSAGGAATSANKLNTNAGNHVNPVYFSDGIPVACTYSISANVPFDAKFTDTNTWRPCVNNLTSDSTDQSLSAAQGKILKDKLDKLVPIGYIFIWNNRKLTNFNETLSGAPALTSAQAVHDYFGFGTWQQVSDTFLYGNPNSQGGASTVSLGVGNMPSHTHSIPALSGWAANNGAHAHNVRAKYTNNCATKSGGSARANGGGNNTSDWRFGDTDSQGVHGHNVSTNASTTGSNGSGSAFSIMPPYKGVYIWQRIA